ncbi:hypothetical protein [Streptomyces meridianus]|uniref:Uncharacterized protein n=1 Tax=Streptomyces meridianus TaxID=2938945 RepID=A0ABT0XB30_9ACTN|nr:hypothetical protein [Streptomyces meridianus]MCM2579717.1 hypothetical protein [Streptomyces meridianus]
MTPPPASPSTPSVAEAGAWAEVLVCRRLLHAAVLVPTGQWLVQREADEPVRVLAGTVDVVELAAAVQYRIRSTRPETR